MARNVETSVGASLNRPSERIHEYEDQADARVRAVERLLFQSRLQERACTAPLTGPVTPSCLFERLRVFLPEMRAANELLARRKNQGEAVALDSDVLIATSTSLSTTEPTVEVVLLNAPLTETAGCNTSPPEQVDTGLVSQKVLPNTSLFGAPSNDQRSEQLQQVQGRSHANSAPKRCSLIEELPSSPATGSQPETTSWAFAVSPCRDTPVKEAWPERREAEARSVESFLADDPERSSTLQSGDIDQLQ